MTGFSNTLEKMRQGRTQDSGETITMGKMSTGLPSRVGLITELLVGIKEERVKKEAWRYEVSGGCENMRFSEFKLSEVPLRVDSFIRGFHLKSILLKKKE